jgi:hypothetical protein
MRAELAVAGIAPVRNAVISVEPGEAYRLDNDDAPDDDQIIWFVSALSPAQASGLPVPEA